MATSTPAPAAGFNFAALLPIIELLANVGLVAAGTAGVVPPGSAALAAAIEGGINPLIASIQAGNSKTQDAVVAMSALISTLNVMKANTKDPALLGKITEYTTAAQAGLAGYLDGSKGFNAASFAPVAPIA